MKKIAKQIKDQFEKRYPRNFLIRKPVIGTMVFLIFIFGFVVIYQPLEVHGARSFSFDFTMLLYSIIISVSVFVLLLILKRIHFFSKNEEWNFFKELLFDLIILTGIGISAYFAGFVIEEPVPRWNLPTFFDSFRSALLLGFIPVLFFTILNIRYLFTPETSHDFILRDKPSEGKDAEELIHIISKAKKEELDFYPNQFIYAESQGNYVVFHLFIDGKPHEVMIRNSIKDIEQQLKVIPYFMRIHRAFIVNLNKVTSKTGNTLGYRLKLAGSNNIIPVSRQNTRSFDHLMK
ncbi:MAG: LytTR family transcriptional regulator [Bacteroidetes bacterium]|nr:LytTR family transcriptional regulator [Bacteroidota bacterium]